MSLTVYLFDIDGTLLLSGGAGNRALEETFQEAFGIAGAMREVTCAGKTDPSIVTEVFRTVLGRDPSGDEVREIIERYLEHLQNTLEESTSYKLLPGVPTALERLRAAGHRLGIATGNHERGAALKLARGGLERYFTFGGFGSDSADRATLVGIAARRAEAELGRTLRPDEVVVVGDTPHDVSAARKNGFACIAIASGTVPARDLEAAAPDRIVTSLDDL